MKLNKMKILLLSLIVIISFNGCSQKEYIIKTPKCAKIKVLPKVPTIEVTTNNKGGLDANQTIKVFNLIKKLRRVEDYYINAIKEQTKANMRRL